MAGFNGYGNGYGNGGHGNGYGNDGFDPNRNGNSAPYPNRTQQVRAFRPVPLPQNEKPRYRKGGGLLGSLLGAAAVNTETGALLHQRAEQERQMQAARENELQEQLAFQRMVAERKRQMELQQRSLNIPPPVMPAQNDGVLPNSQRVCKNCGMIVTGNFCEFCGSVL